MNKGIRFYLDEWAVVHSLQQILEEDFTGTVKQALRESAEKRGLKWPRDKAA